MVRHAQFSVISYIGFCNYDYVICIRLSCDQCDPHVTKRTFWQ